MNFIIYDLEATCWEGRPPSMTQETIEVGAVSVNNYGEVTGSFNKFIKPVIHPFISAYCTELTTIQQVDVSRADEFPYVMEQFQDWIGVFEEDYLLCSWGDFDKTILVQDCDYHDFETDWLDPHTNLKRQYMDIKKLRKPIGLKKAVTREGYEFTGIHHRGISDAENLAKVFCKYLDEWRY